MNYVVIIIAFENHSKNAGHITILYFTDILVHIGSALINMN
jgi:hypothetical protein